jgi:hypothetical protein
MSPAALPDPLLEPLAPPLPLLLVLLPIRVPLPPPLLLLLLLLRPPKDPPLPPKPNASSPALECSAATGAALHPKAAAMTTSGSIGPYFMCAPPVSPESDLPSPRARHGPS